MCVCNIGAYTQPHYGFDEVVVKQLKYTQKKATSGSFGVWFYRQYILGDRLYWVIWYSTYYILV